MVVNTGDNNGVNPSPGAGTGTLRQAIVDADFSAGPQSIEFKIPGKNLHTISLASPLPAIFYPLIIDGTSQDGFVFGQPVIDLDGTNAGGGDGLVFLDGGNIVRGLIINNFHGNSSGGNGFGIVLDGTIDPSGGSLIDANFIGTDSTGSLAEGNNGGILIHSSSHNQIGGLNSDGNLVFGNLISGNKTTGIFIDDQAATDNHIVGNFIGTDVFGLKSIGNGTDGVFVGPPAGAPSFGFSSGNFISDFDVLSKTISVDARNVISGNKHNGVYILGGSQNLVQGNYIGLGVDGATPVPNSEDGVRIEDASLNTVGGTVDGSRNVISANKGAGVEILGSDQSENLVAMSQSATNNLIQGNFIGTDATGTFSDPDKMPNSGDELGNTNGIELRNNSTNAAVVVSFNFIGGTTDAARNIISGNLQDGILMVGARVDDNLVDGNYIGTDKLGANAIPNTNTGINLDSLTGQTVGPSGNVIGGTDAGAANVISGNGIPKSQIGDGVFIANGSNANLVLGNKIGTNALGLAQLGNVDDGVVIENAANNFIGGPADGDMNIISGNLTDGVEIDGSDAKNNVVQRNRIGLAMDFSKLGNRNGVLITQVAGDGSPSGNLIGGTQGVGDQEVGLGNIISGNTLDGVDIAGGATQTQVVGNFIGTDLLGSVGLGNRHQGVAIDNSPFNIIGGTTAAGRNIIVNNGLGVTNIDGGVVITGPTSIGNVVQGNNIGIGSDGVSPLPNNGDGVLLVNATLNTIGGGVLRNIISGNSLNGVNIQGAQATSNVVLGNYIGTTADGSAPQANTGNGVLITNGAASNTIGGPGDPGRNVISGNSLNGVAIVNAGAGNVLQNNYIGLNAQGTDAVKNTNFGVGISDSPSTIIGGDDKARNVIAGQTAGGSGIVLAGPLTTGTQIKGNFIGTDKDAGKSLGNSFGITLGSNTKGVASQTIISGNVIAGNLQAGIALFFGTSDNHIENNIIGTNAAGITTIPNIGFGIDINNSPSNFIGGTGAGTGNVIDFTAKDPNQDPAIGSGDGIMITGANSKTNVVTSNALVQNAGDGIRIGEGASGNFIGNLTALGNVIVSNAVGVHITGQGTDSNVVLGNRIGVNSSAQPSGNQGFGVLLDLGASQNTIGAVGGYGNVISANGGGISIQQNANDNNVISNYVGAGLDGSFQQGFGNLGAGILISNATGNTIGGETIANQVPTNLIVGNAVGVKIDGLNAGAQQNVIQSNSITNSSSYGVYITGGASNNTIGNSIGDTKAQEANVIDGNSAAGVFVESGTGNEILNDNIFNNGGLNIDLAPLGVINALLPRKVIGDGPNNLQNAPVLTSATISNGNLRIVGTLESAVNQVYTLQVFTVGDAGTLVFLVATTTVATNGSGIGFFPSLDAIAISAGGVTVGTSLVATATDSQHNTSEFSQPIQVALDSDGDGIGDDVENAGPEANAAQNASIASFQDAANDGNYITLVAPPGVTFQDVRPLENPAPDAPNGPPSNVQFNAGFIEFKITNVPAKGVVNIQEILPVGSPTPIDYYRYGPTPDNAAPHWYNWKFDASTGTGATFNGNIITLHFVDGARGDDDLAADGTIEDAGAPGFFDPFTVTNTADSGDGSLRQAILNANAHPGTDVITFNVAGAGPESIQPLSALPTITDSVTIDGTTQPGYNGTPLIELDGEEAGSGVDGLTIDSGNATIQGLVINRFSGAGILIESDGSGEILGNFIGTDVSGTGALGNGSFGIVIDKLASTFDSISFIGNANPSSKNVISGNAAGGIMIEGSQASFMEVESNYIGTQVDGLSPLGNGGPGILLSDGASFNNIGTSSPDQGNIIAFNAGAGVETLQSQGNHIEANSIFANSGLGIDLGGDGVTPNDPNDSDGLQNYPVLTHIASYGGRTYFTGTLSSSPGSSFTLDFYSSAAADPSGFGEGQTFLGATSLKTDSTGQAAFDFSLETSVAAGSFVTATATNNGGRTSEFSAAMKLPVSEVLTFTVNTTDDVNNAVPDPAHFSLREAILAANSHPGQDIIRFDLPNADRTISPLSPLPDITDPVIIDGTTQPGFAGLPLIELDGSQAGAGTDGLVISGGGSIIRALVINRFQYGITLEGLGGNTIEGDFLGTDVTGTNALPDGFADVYVNGSPDNLIGGTTAAARNVILKVNISGFDPSGNRDTSGNRIEGNYIGTDLTGTVRLVGGVLGTGISIGSASSNVIGGTELGAGNLIEGDVAFADASNNVVQGNLIGTDFTGTVALSGDLEIDSGSANLIGGTTTAARNIITGGVSIGGSGNLVQGNYIGTDITGTVALGYSNFTIFDVGSGGVLVGGTDNIVGGVVPGAGNLISGFNPASDICGVILSGNDNTLQGNRIGTDVTGTKSLGNFIGVLCHGFNNLIGGIEPGAGNLISGNSMYGLSMSGGAGNTAQGNFIGTDVTGAKAIGNGDGVYVSEKNDTIGGSQSGAGNLISGNRGNGIGIDQIEGAATGIVIQGNFIGTDVTGMSRLGNGAAGIYIASSPNNVIGGTTPGAGNVISANGGSGVSIFDSSAANPSTGNVVQGNKIGTGMTGNGNLGNAGDGVSIITSSYVASNETVGGAAPGAGNVIAFNGGAGVRALFGIGNAIRDNDIFANASLGIINDIQSVLSTYAEQRSLDLLTNIPDPVVAYVNGVLETFTQERGADLLANIPALTSALFDLQGTVLEGTLTGTPFTVYHVDFFANDAIDPSGFGEGQKFLESDTVQTDETGSAQFRIRLELAIPVGQWITATATGSAGDTTQFSRAIPVVTAVEANAVQFSAPAYLVTANGAAAVVVVTRTGSTAGAVTVDYATADGSAKAGTDYTAQSGTLTFADGEVSQTLTIPIQAATLAQVDENFSIVLTNPAGVSLGSVPEAVVTIADDDAAGQIAFSSGTPASFPERQQITLVVTRTGGSVGSVTVDYRVTSGTAVPLVIGELKVSSAGITDYQDFYGTLTFKDGQTTADITVTEFGQNPGQVVYRGPQTIVVTLGNPTGGATLGAITQTVLTIQDDDDLNGGFGISPFSNSEVGEAAGKATLFVYRSGNTTGTESVDYSTVDGTATAGADYVATSGTLTFMPGETQKTITIGILDRHLTGGSEAFQVVLSNPTGGAVLDAAGTGSYGDTLAVIILNSDTAGRAGALAATSVQVQENAGTALITVDRLDGSSGVVQVNYATSDGTATAGSDYTAMAGTLTFNNGEMFKTFSVPILPDNLVEGDETFFVTLSNATGGATIDAANPAVETIYETPGQFQFSAANSIVADSNAGYTFTVVFTGPPEPSDRLPGTVTVDYTTQDGTATAGANYTPVSGTLTFSNSGRQTITIPILNDPLAENDRTILQTLSNATGGPSIGAEGTATLTILNDPGTGTTGTTTTVNSDLSSGATYGQLDTFTATVSADSGTPTGSVQFQVDGADFGSPVVLSGGTASINTAALPAGQHSVVVFYTSDSTDFSGSDNSANPLDQLVSPAVLTIAADNKTMIYGGAVPTLSDTFTGLVNGDTPATFDDSPNGPPTLTTSPATSHTGQYAISVGGAVDPNYTISYLNGMLTINPAPLTISADNKTMVQDTSLPTLTATYTGLVNGDTPATFNANPNDPPSLKTVPANSPPGNYAITIGGAADADYTIAFVDGSLAITSSSAPAVVTLSGTIFFDYNSDGVLNPGEPGLAGRTVFLDLKHSGQLDAGDPSTVTATDGAFQFAGLTAGSYTVREEVLYDNVALTSSVSVVVSATGDVSGINFGNVLYNPAFPVYPAADLYAPHPEANATTAYVRGLYQAILDRNADQAGLAFWVSALNAGVPNSEVAYVFVNSQEHRQDEVKYYYESFLGRAPDSASAGWVNQLMNGGNEAEVIQGILTSPEYTAKHASNPAFITDLYFHLLGRQADSADQTFWDQELASGVSRSEIVADFLNSQESAKLASESFYAAFLHRAKDQPGDDHWVGLLTSQTQTFGQVASDFFSVAPFEFQESAGRNVP